MNATAQWDDSKDEWVIEHPRQECGKACKRKVCSNGLLHRCNEECKKEHSNPSALENCVDKCQEKAFFFNNFSIPGAGAGATNKTQAKGSGEGQKRVLKMLGSGQKRSLKKQQVKMLGSGQKQKNDEDAW
jgi:hypothetical protein